MGYLKKNGHEVVQGGVLTGGNAGWADIGYEAAKNVASGAFDLGIFFCWSGTGICMAANKAKGARAALCWDAETGRLARKWNNPNILCMSLRYTGEDLAKQIIDVWFAADFDEEGLNQAHNLDKW